MTRAGMTEEQNDAEISFGIGDFFIQSIGFFLGHPRHHF